MKASLEGDAHARIPVWKSTEPVSPSPKLVPYDRTR